MNNYGLATADRLTHVKVVAVALIACTAIIGACKAARQGPSDTAARMEIRTPVMVAGKPVLWTSAGQIIR